MGPGSVIRAAPASIREPEFANEAKGAFKKFTYRMRRRLSDGVPAWHVQHVKALGDREETKEQTLSRKFQNLALRE